VAHPAYLPLPSLNLLPSLFPQLHRLVPPVNFCQSFVNSLFAGQSLDADPAPVLLLDRALAPVPAGVVALVGLLEGPRPVRRALQRRAAREPALSSLALA